VHNVVLWTAEYDETMDRMRLPAVELTDRDQELLAKAWRAALAAAASIDPSDCETIAGHRVYSGDVHWYYRLISRMVEEILSEKGWSKGEDERQKRLAEREPVDDTDSPF
jgi:hypothetical protein